MSGVCKVWTKNDGVFQLSCESRVDRECWNTALPRSDRVKQTASIEDNRRWQVTEWATCLCPLSRLFFVPLASSFLKPCMQYHTGLIRAAVCRTVRQLPLTLNLFANKEAYRSMTLGRRDSRFNCQGMRLSRMELNCISCRQCRSAAVTIDFDVYYEGIIQLQSFVKKKEKNWVRRNEGCHQCRSLLARNILVYFVTVHIMQLLVRH